MLTQENIEDIFAFIGDPILMVNDKSEIIFCNDAFCKMFGYSTVEIIGSSLNSLISEDNANLNHADLVSNYIKSNAPPMTMMAREAIQCVNSKGQSIPVNISLSNINSDTENIGIAILHDFSAIEKEKKEQEKLARTDQLTGLSNRRHFDELLEQGSLLYENSTIGVIYIDLNKFKPVNDEYGHETGDTVLHIISQRISNILRDTDITCRIGGDEFVIFALNIVSKENLSHLSQKISNSISNTIHTANTTFSLGASIGACLYPEDGTDIKGLVKLADRKMYDEKKMEK
ncbi:MAG: sensor domain-containing diguanylate cyclase [Proteobacteria bacterium]|nr:diguanylate cyclase [Pseudomonadota bacterium]NOG59349.1 sensor domain-containing diguanylate cyclase [Pseudomonadota bacterium]